MQMEAAIEDLRVKYEKIRAEEAKVKEAKESADRAAAAAEEAKREKDWVMTEDVDLEKIRQERIAALKETAEARRSHREAGNGAVHEIAEDEFLRDVTSAALVAVHFFHPEFETCKVMDKHLRLIAARALQTKFLRINGALRGQLLLHAASSLAHCASVPHGRWRWLAHARACSHEGRFFRGQAAGQDAAHDHLLPRRRGDRAAGGLRRPAHHDNGTCRPGTGFERAIVLPDHSSLCDGGCVYGLCDGVPGAGDAQGGRVRHRAHRRRRRRRGGH